MGTGEQPGGEDNGAGDSGEKGAGGEESEESDGASGDAFFFVLPLSGDVGAPEVEAAGAAARERLEVWGPAGRAAVILDLSGAVYLGEEGLASLVGLRRDLLREGGARLLLAAPSPFARGKLTRTGLGRLFPIHPDLEAARQDARGGGLPTRT